MCLSVCSPESALSRGPVGVWPSWSIWYEGWTWPFLRIVFQDRRSMIEGQTVIILLCRHIVMHDWHCWSAPAMLFVYNWHTSINSSLNVRTGLERSRSIQMKHCQICSAILMSFNLQWGQRSRSMFKFKVKDKIFEEIQASPGHAWLQICRDIKLRLKHP